jgi:hypothetical protein
MGRSRTPRSHRWLQWATGLLLIVAAGTQPRVTAAAAPQIPTGAARIWFYQGYEPPGRAAQVTSIPTVVANGTYVGQAPPGTVFYRDVPPGHYDITIPGFNGRSAHFDVGAGQQAFVKLVFRTTGGHDAPNAQGLSALLVPEQIAQAELATVTPEAGQR